MTAWKEGRTANLLSVVLGVAPTRGGYPGRPQGPPLQRVLRSSRLAASAGLRPVGMRKQAQQGPRGLHSAEFERALAQAQ